MVSVRILRPVKFAVTSIALNVFFVLLTSPIRIANVASLPYNSDLRDVFRCLFRSSFCINFFILFAFNPVSRQEFISIFYVKRQMTTQVTLLHKLSIVIKNWCFIYSLVLPLFKKLFIFPAKFIHSKFK